MGDVERVGADIADGVIKAGQYAVDVDGEPVTLLSLPPKDIAEIQRRYDLRWLTILMDPVGRVDAAGDLVEAAYRKAGKEPPPLETVEDVLRCFVELPAANGATPEPEPEE